MMVDTWQNVALAQESKLRLLAFAVTLGLLWLLEQWRMPVADAKQQRRRWRENFGLMLIDSVLLRFAFPMLAVQFALINEARGLLPALTLPGWLTGIIGFLLLDVIIYFQHRISHRLQWFWRLHRVHHSDADFDVSLAVRFHPVEIAISMLVKITAIALLGVPALAVLVFELALSIGALWTHARLALPQSIERWVRWVLITPTLHRVHHRLETSDQNSNFGSVLVWWDWLFGSLRLQAQSTELTFGLRAPTPLGLWALLSLPFRKS